MTKNKRYYLTALLLLAITLVSGHGYADMAAAVKNANNLTTVTQNELSKENAAEAQEPLEAKSAILPDNNQPKEQYSTEVGSSHALSMKREQYIDLIREKMQLQADYLGSQGANNTKASVIDNKSIERLREQLESMPLKKEGGDTAPIEILSDTTLTDQVDEERKLKTPSARVTSIPEDLPITSSGDQKPSASKDDPDLSFLQRSAALMKALLQQPEKEVVEQ